jgi:CBS domain-containing protein
MAPLPPDLGFDEAIQRLRGSRLPALPVVEGGRLIGLVTLDNVTDLLLIRRAVGKG